MEFCEEIAVSTDSAATGYIGPQEYYVTSSDR